MIRTIAIIVSLVFLAGCDTTGTGTLVKCGAFKRIEYSARNDTGKTVKQVRVHNQTMNNLHCPK